MQKECDLASCTSSVHDSICRRFLHSISLNPITQVVIYMSIQKIRKSRALIYIVIASFLKKSKYNLSFNHLYLFIIVILFLFFSFFGINKHPPT